MKDVENCCGLLYGTNPENMTISQRHSSYSAEIYTETHAYEAKLITTLWHLVNVVRLVWKNESPGNQNRLRAQPEIYLSNE